MHCQLDDTLKMDTRFGMMLSQVGERRPGVFVPLGGLGTAH